MPRLKPRLRWWKRPFDSRLAKASIERCARVARRQLLRTTLALVQHTVVRERRPVDLDEPRVEPQLVHDRQHSQWPAIAGPVEDKVVGPHVVPVLGPQTHARPVIQPQSTPLGLLLRHFQSFPTPQPFDTLVVHSPPLPT